MIGVIFQYESEYVEVIIEGNSLYFRTSQFGSQIVPIEGLRFDKAGVIKEFPDLENNNKWREESIKRLKEKIKLMTNEEQVYNYIVHDLIKYGYIPKVKQKSGFRPERIII